MTEPETKGEYRVGLDFNPFGSPAVAGIKRAAAGHLYPPPARGRENEGDEGAVDAPFPWTGERLGGGRGRRGLTT